MTPKAFSKRNTPTGIAAVPSDSVYYKGVRIIVLDQHMRLPYNFAIVCGRNYKEFPSLRQAQKFIREAQKVAA
jgi:hypothetical protein